MVVVGIDPGRVTGLCVFGDAALQTGREARTYIEIRDFIDLWAPEAVVIENYLVRPSRHSDYAHPIKVIGAVELICDERGIQIIYQSPSILRFTQKSARGMHKSRHVRSACAHVIYYLKKRGLYAQS
jgi:hypothetical protein